MAQEVKGSITHATSTTALTTGSSVSASCPSRPTSSYTLDSTFADSGVDMDATTPTEMPTEVPDKETSYMEPTIPLSPENVDQSLSDKMRQLAAVAWTLEQDDSMNTRRRRKLHKMLRDLETHLEGSSDEDGDVLGAVGATSDLSQRNEGASEKHVTDEEEDVWIEESDLIVVRETLSATVLSMRQRCEEQEHLHDLTAQKLEAVAQRCLEYEKQAQDLLRELEELRNENHMLGSENEELRGQVLQMQEEASRKEVAVEAMSSAVTGLEGWIESTNPSRDQTPVPAKTKRPRVVIRGKGRFRGRYYVDEDGDQAVAYSLADAASEGQELHDGVKAWLRGFRDVEEELRQHESPGRSGAQARFQSPGARDADDWGDFESPDT